MFGSFDFLSKLYLMWCVFQNQIIQNKYIWLNFLLIKKYNIKKIITNMAYGFFPSSFKNILIKDK